MKLNIPTEKPREIPPAGFHYAVCCTVVDLGTQPSPYGAKRQLYIAWEIEEASRSKPHIIGKFYNITSNERGLLRQDLESWFGKQLGTAELGELNLLEVLLGRTAKLGIMHNVRQDGQSRATVTSVMPSQDKPEKAQIVSAPIVFGFDDGFDKQSYDGLPNWLRTIVARSPEYTRAINPESVAETKWQGKKHGTGTTRRAAQNAVDDLADDEIPF
jgi:hypothetical protein